MNKEEVLMYYFLKEKDDFHRVYFKAKIEEFLGKIFKRNQKFISFQEISNIIDINNKIYRGINTVKLENIIGSVNRYNDFDRNFYPLKLSLSSKWEKIADAYHNDINLPIVKLYKIGDVFFVIDGNHRVSVAKSLNIEFIDAEVIEIKTKYKLTKNSTRDDLILQYKSSDELKIKINKLELYENSIHCKDICNIKS